MSDENLRPPLDVRIRWFHRLYVLLFLIVAVRSAMSGRIAESVGWGCFGLGGVLDLHGGPFQGRTMIAKVALTVAGICLLLAGLRH